MPICKELGLTPPEKGVGTYEDFFELTKHGEAINLNEYAAWIADTRDSEAYKAYAAHLMSIPQSNGEFVKPEDVPFKSRTHVICASDF